MASSTHSGRKKRILIMFALTFLYMVAELIVGYKAESIALIADSFHMFSDVISLIIAFISIMLSPKKWKKSTFGWARAEVLGALINSVFLMALCFTIVMESVQRFIEPRRISDPKLVLGVGIGGLVVNLVGLCIFHEGHGHSHSKSPIQHQGRLTRLVVSEDEGSGSDLDIDKQSTISGDQSPVEPINQAPPFSILSPKIPLIVTEGKEKDEKDKSFHDNIFIKNSKLPSFKNKMKRENTNVQLSDDLDHNNLQSSDESSRDSSIGAKETKSHGKASHQLNMHGVFLHILADTLGSVVVIISASIIWATEEHRNDDSYKFVDYIDPLLSVIMVGLIVCSSWPLLQETSMILLQTIPTNIEIEDLKFRLRRDVPGILGIHEFHVWQLAGDRVIASIHLVCNNVEDYVRIAREAKYFFHLNGIHSTTIQAEFTNYNGSELQEHECLLNCPTDGNMKISCATSTCCGVAHEDST